MLASSSSAWQRSQSLRAVVLVVSLLGCSKPPQPETNRSTVAESPAMGNESPGTESATGTSSTTLSSPAPQATNNSLQALGESNVSSRAAFHANDAIAQTVSDRSVQSKSQPNPPLHLEEVLQRIDLRKFPFMEGNSRSSASIESYGSSAPVSEKFSVDSVMSYLDKLLLDAGCVRGTDSSLEMRAETAASTLYWHGDLMITASCGISRGSTGSEINSGIHIEGNVDLRNVPTPPNSTSTASKPNSLRLLGSAEILELRKFYSFALNELGWTEFRDYLPGVSVPVSTQLLQQKFLKNGVFISIYYHRSGKGEASDGQVETNVSMGVLEYEPTLPSHARSVQLRQRSPMALTFETKLSPQDLRAFYDAAYLSRGYSSDGHPTGKDDQEFAVTYSHPNNSSLRFEAKQLGETSIVVANEIKRVQ